MHNTSRHCTRCGKDLTDAASMEAGIGPICRDLDNALLARLIPSDLPKARALFNEVDLTAVAPETLKTVNEVYAALFADDAPERDDWRKEVKRIEWALSFPANNYLRGALTDVVAALGYIGLSALWNGDAKTGKAIVSFMNGYIFVQAAKCKAANLTFRLIQGRKFNSVGTIASIPKASWSFPSKEHAAVYFAVIKHYPNFVGLNEAIEEAKIDAAAYEAKKQVTIDMETHPIAPVVEQPAAKAHFIKPGVNILTLTASAPTVAKITAPVTAPKCSIAKVGVLLKVQTPYKPEYVNDLKSSVKYTDRRWNAHERVWELPLMHEEKVQELVKKHFGAEAALLP